MSSRWCRSTVGARAISEGQQRRKTKTNLEFADPVGLTVRAEVVSNRVGVAVGDGVHEMLVSASEIAASDDCEVALKSLTHCLAT